MFIIMEIQVFEDNKMSTPCYAFAERNSAEQKYHSILSSAAVSKLPKHSAVMLTDDGYYIKSESFTHAQEASDDN